MNQPAHIHSYLSTYMYKRRKTCGNCMYCKHRKSIHKNAWCTFTNFAKWLTFAAFLQFFFPFIFFTVYFYQKFNVLSFSLSIFLYFNFFPPHSVKLRRINCKLLLSIRNLNLILRNSTQTQRKKRKVICFCFVHFKSCFGTKTRKK